jgi:hypothetical protein
MNKRVANATVAFATQYIVAKGLNIKPRACAWDLLLLYTVANATGSICHTLLFIPANICAIDDIFLF